MAVSAVPGRISVHRLSPSSGLPTTLTGVGAAGRLPDLTRLTRRNVIVVSGVDAERTRAAIVRRVGVVPDGVGAAGKTQLRVVDPSACGGERGAGGRRRKVGQS